MKILTFFLIIIISKSVVSAGSSSEKMPRHQWSFNGITGTFDQAAIQRGYKVYREVCEGCHSIKLLYYRDLIDIGFSEAEVKAIASEYTVLDGPNDDGDMFTRAAKLSDKFVGPYQNDKEAMASNGGAYPPDFSVLVKARSGGADYIYSLLLGYEDPPSNVILDDGVYYNKYMYGNMIRMPNPLSDGLIEYNDGTEATEEQMAKDLVTFLAWTAEPHLEARHKIGFKAIIYLLILTILVYFSMKRLWSRVEPEI